MGSFGEPANLGNAFIMSLPDMDLFLGNEAFVWWHIRSQVDSNVVWCMEEVTALVIDRVVN